MYEKAWSWLVPYVKSRVLPGEFHPHLAYLFTDWRVARFVGRLAAHGFQGGAQSFE